MSAPLGSRWLGRRHLFAVGRQQVPSYTLMLYLGCVAGVFAGAAVAEAEGLSRRRFVFAAIVLLVPALAGARLWYVLQHFERYWAEPSRVFRRAEAGMALYGGLVLGVAASIPVLALARLPFWGFWDAASITMLVGSAITRLGCLMNGCCAGRATSGPLGVWLPNHRGEWRRRFPTPLLDAGWAIVLLVWALTAGAGLPVSGARFAAVVGAYGAGRVVLELTRESARPPRTVSIDFVFSLALLIGAGAWLIWGLPG